MIPEEAVQAAAKAHHEIRVGSWEGAHADTQAVEIEDMRAALEAAAPFIRAKALEEAADDFEDNVGVTEFDEQSRRDGSRWAHIDDAWEYQGPYMDWLRARAVTERGGD